MAAFLLAATFSFARSSLSAAACALHHEEAVPHAQSLQTLQPQLPQRSGGCANSRAALKPAQGSLLPCNTLKASQSIGARFSIAVTESIIVPSPEDSARATQQGIRRGTFYTHPSSPEMAGNYVMLSLIILWMGNTVGIGRGTFWRGARPSRSAYPGPSPAPPAAAPPPARAHAPAAPSPLPVPVRRPHIHSEYQAGGASEPCQQGQPPSHSTTSCSLACSFLPTACACWGKFSNRRRLRKGRVHARQVPLFSRTACTVCNQS